MLLDNSEVWVGRGGGRLINSVFHVLLNNSEGWVGWGGGGGCLGRLTSILRVLFVFLDFSRKPILKLGFLVWRFNAEGVLSDRFLEGRTE